jgi:hypothetical protein
MVFFSLVDCLNARLTWVIVRSGQTAGIFFKNCRLDWINEKVLNLFKLIKNQRSPAEHGSTAPSKDFPHTLSSAGGR